MEIHQIRYFMALCDEANFTRAARKVDVSQPSLTRAIQLLEREFGGPLFSRERSRIELTALGRAVEPYLREAWQQASGAQVVARNFAGRKPRQITIGIMCTIAPALFVDFIKGFRKRHPSLQIHVVDGTAEAIEKGLIEMKIDVGIYSRPGSPLDPRLTRINLFREQMMIALASDHPLAGKRAIRVADLAGQSYVRRSFCEFDEMAGREFESQGVSCETAYTSDRDDWIHAMVASGAGFGFIPRHSVRPAEVVAIPLVDPEFWRDVYITTVTDRSQHAAVNDLLQLARRFPWGEPDAAGARRDRQASAGEVA
jgi:DNA-binding transcriptional LysR family regulator